MSYYNEEEYNEASYSGEEDDDYEEKEEIPSCKITSTLPITLKTSNNDERIGITTFLSINNGNISTQCFTNVEFKSFMKNRPPLFLYGGEANESFPLMKLLDNTVVECNYYMLMRYSTFLLYSPYKIPIGSAFGVSRDHGNIETVFRIIPVPRASMYNINSLMQNLFTAPIKMSKKEDFSAGNCPPYSVDVKITPFGFHESERRSTYPVLENIFLTEGSFASNLRFGKNRSETFFFEEVSYTDNYESKKFNSEIVKSEVESEDTEIKVTDDETKYIITVKRNGEKFFNNYVEKERRESENIEDEDEDDLMDAVISNDITKARRILSNHLNFTKNVTRILIEFIGGLRNENDRVSYLSRINLLVNILSPVNGQEISPKTHKKIAELIINIFPTLPNIVQYQLLKNLFDYIVNTDLFKLPPFNTNSRFKTGMWNKLLEFENKNIEEVGEFNPKIWIPVTKEKLSYINQS